MGGTGQWCSANLVCMRLWGAAQGQSSELACMRPYVGLLFNTTKKKKKKTAYIEFIFKKLKLGMGGLLINHVTS